ncbi:S41 family peptidase [Prevotella communis]|uniref:S41 family peptidase n=1 Tax=Prevotella communis TaxID=2913614 RepID=UPI001EDA7F4A|nr:S41 family peptidase [Prevotella communis]UKK67996.1 S41 family peptidase [Prevotella communis]UKK69869.1 S41 family peptidase [Prevotella communis]
MRKLLYILCLIPLFISCVDEEEFADTPQGNMEALWKIIDEHYCFLEYKQQEYGLNWDAVHEKYKERVKGKLTRKQQFEVLCDMLGELRDGHVNLSAAHDFGRYWSWFEDYPTNFSDTLLRRYMGTDYQIASGISYKILDDNIGYIRYESFNDPIGEGNLNEALSHMILCRGLIIDIRSNGGGMLTNAEKLAARFCQEKTLVGYYQHKTGPGHQDFSDKEARYLEPSANVRWNKPAVVLTNRRVYSAANEFAVYMKTLPNVRLVGDHTGGGAGMPFSSSLPCGWSVRFSAVPMYDAQGESAEFGIEPDYNVQQTDEDFAKGKDTLIEFARQLLVQ